MRILRKIVCQIIYMIFIFSIFENTMAHDDSNFDPEDSFTINATIPSNGLVRALVIFATFQDRPQQPLPSWIHDIFDPAVPNSITHYYNVQSNGLHTITGEVIDHWIYVPYNHSRYMQKYTFIRSVLQQVDAEVNFTLYDNWNSSRINEPDGKVDIIFINIADSPWGSVANLSLNDYPFYYETNDSGAAGIIKIYSNSGTTQRFNADFEKQVGGMAHEYGHTLGLEDLYDQTYRVPNATPEEYSAGIGFWGLMSEGYGMWGLYSMCEYNKAKLGWIPTVSINSDTFNLVVTPNVIYKVKPPAFQNHEYFLVTYRNHNNFYDRKLPAGLLIWHIDESQQYENLFESHKLIDLECADGLFDDKGYPATISNPNSGADNLDFWSKPYPEYTSIHQGNTFDNTDPFDGVNFTSFTPYTNPNSNGYRGNTQSKVSQLAITNIRPRGICDIIFNYWEGEIVSNTTWNTSEGSYFLGADITVPSGVTLQIEDDVKIEHNGYSIKSTGGIIIRGDTITSIAKNKNSPFNYLLEQNYPNPFNSSTTIQYSLAADSWVTLTIYNSLGQQVKKLVDTNQGPGMNKLTWNGQDESGVKVPSGAYFYRLEAEAFSQTRKMLLIQ